MRPGRADLLEEEWNAACRARVLLAEDDDELRSMLASALRRRGFGVVEVKNGIALLERLMDPGSPAFDLIVTDVRMPGLSGLEVIGSAQPEGWINTPVILITAFGDAELHEEAGRLGALVLDKPFDIDELTAQAESLVGPKLS
jgi:DNA-binding response OmpR family regulator